MLKRLQASNLALVESAQVEFEPGLNVITGETGAGKSLLIGALNLTLGERADRGIVRAGAEQCSAEAVFHLEDAAPVNAVLEEIGLPPCVDGEVILRRVVVAGGHGRQYINDHSVTLQALQRVGDCLADMHGPHQHQSLLSPRAQLELLDAYGKLERARLAYAKTFAEFDGARRALQEIESQPAAAPPAWLEEQVRELTEADLTEAEETRLVADQRLLGNAQRILELMDTFRRRLTEDEDCAFNAAASALRALEEMANLTDAPGGWENDLRGVLDRLRDLTREADAFMQRAECDPERLAQVESRLATYRKLKHKYGGSVAAALEKLNEAQSALDDARLRETRLAQLTTQVEKTRQAAQASAERLSAGRRQATASLSAAVQRELRALELSRAEFAVTLTDIPLGSTGTDAVEFVFTANPGEPPRDLRKAASAGEISRVMLAVKSVLARHDRVPVLVFDEIDVNLGGRAAGVVGRKLRELARHRQVLCITHLPQVAACGNAHFAVRKISGSMSAATEVQKLDEKARVVELVRMLGGEATAVAVRHAGEMLRRAGVGISPKEAQKSGK
ncbi:MAG: DNA repair protein RecN [Kiritimatiellia bacterium]|jgi:DNA repair protein RecN (Recombination protein N)